MTDTRQEILSIADELDLWFGPNRPAGDKLRTLAERFALPEDVEQVIKLLRKQSYDVYLAAVKDVADDISDGLKTAASTIESLQAQVGALSAERDELFGANITRVPQDVYYEMKRRAEAAEAALDALTASKGGGRT